LVPSVKVHKDTPKVNPGAGCATLNEVTAWSKPATGPPVGTDAGCGKAIPTRSWLGVEQWGWPLTVGVAIQRFPEPMPVVGQLPCVLCSYP